jgi:mono/diheme cytochrome c family protein
MYKRYGSLLHSCCSSARSISMIHMLVTALMLSAWGSVACSKQPTNETTNHTPAANQSATPAGSPITLPAQVTEEAKNPLPDLVAAAAAGKPLYQANCALCHGDTGESDGPASASFNPKPTILTKGDVTTDPDGKLFLVTKNGKGKMPPMKKMTDEQIWQVVAYVRTLAQKEIVSNVAGIDFPRSSLPSPENSSREQNLRAFFCAAKPQPFLFLFQQQLPDQMDSGFHCSKALGRVRPQPHRRKRTLNDVACSQVSPVLAGIFVEVQQAH